MDTSDQYEKMCKVQYNKPQRVVKFRFKIRLDNNQIITKIYTLSQLGVISLVLMEWNKLRMSTVLAQDEWTGLEDNNKTEVYENDNIQFKYLNEIRVAKVVISPGYGAHLDDERGTRLQYALNHSGVVVPEVEE